MAQLKIDQIRKSFGKTDVLKGVDLDIADGEFIVLLGASGCGKSTLLRIIAGLETRPPAAIIIGGQVVDHLPPARRGIAMVFQSYALYPHLDVAGNWAMGLSRPARRQQLIAERTKEAAPDPGHGEPAAAQAVGAVGRPAAAGRDRPRDRAPPRGVPVRRAALQPRCGAARRHVRFEIARLHKQLGATMVYVTHDQVEAMTLADRIVVMDKGDRAAGRLAGGALPPAGQPVRRRLHRLAQDELPQGRAGATAARSGSTAAPASRVGELPRRRTRASWSSASARTASP